MMKSCNSIFVIFLLIFTTLSCSKEDDTTNKTVEENPNFSGFIKATVTYDSGETFEFDGLGNIIWDEIDDTGSFKLSIGAEDQNMIYHSYQAAVLLIELEDVNGPGTYTINPDSPHVKDEYAIGFSNLFAEEHYIMLFYLGSGEIKIDRLDTERSHGSFEFELILVEEPQGGPYTYDNPNNVQSVTISGSYDKHVLMNK